MWSPDVLRREAELPASSHSSLNIAIPGRPLSQLYAPKNTQLQGPHNRTANLLTRTRYLRQAYPTVDFEKSEFGTFRRAHTLALFSSRLTLLQTSHCAQSRPCERNCLHYP